MKPIKRIEVKRLFHGYASVRDYVLQTVTEGIVIEYPEGEFYVPKERFKEGLVSTEVFTSRHDPTLKYRLVDFDPRAFNKNGGTAQLKLQLT